MADKSFFQFNTATSAGESDITYLGSSNLDFKISIANLRASLSGLVSKTYAQAAALIAAGTLVQGRGYLISDKADAGIILQAATTSSFALQGIGLYYVPDFQDVGTQTGNMKGVWHSGLAGLTANVSIAIYNGLHYKNLTGNVGTAPSGDAVNWVVLAKTLANGYILDEDIVVYDFAGDDVEWRIDVRLNQVNNTYVSNNLFQFGNNDVRGQVFLSQYGGCENINQRGTLVNNVFSNGNTRVTNAHEGDVWFCNFNNGGNRLTFDKNTGVSLTYCTFNITPATTTLDATLDVSNATFDFDTQYATPATGATVTATEFDRKIVLNPAGTIATLTITLSATSLYDGKIMDITTTQVVTAVTINGGTVVGAPAGLSIGFHRLTYIESTSNWYY